MTGEPPPAYDPSQPGLREGLNWVDHYSRELDEEGEPGAMFEIPGVGYKLMDIPESPTHFLGMSFDGTGTKIKESYDPLPGRTDRNYELAGRDAAAMNLNDAPMARGIIRGNGDMIDLPNDDPELKDGFIRGYAKVSYEQGLRVPAGESAVMTLEGMGVYPRMSAAVSFFVKRPEAGADFAEWLQNLNRFQPDDLVIGLPSSGIHANGLTGARRAIWENQRWEALEHLQVPTACYYRALNPLVCEERFGRVVNAMVSVTGEAFRKPLGMLPVDCDLMLDHRDLPPQPIFHLLKEYYSEEEMYGRLNNGVGYLLGVSEEHATDVLDYLDAQRMGAEIIGRVIPGQHRVRVMSAYSDRELVLSDFDR